MTIEIKIKFTPSEFEKIDKVLHTLVTEGWDIVGTSEFSTNIKNKPKLINSKVYHLFRTIK